MSGDDMPSKLVLHVQGPWLADFVGSWLMPSYSVAREAAGLVRTNHDLGPEQERQLLDSVPVAYLPIVDRCRRFPKIDPLGVLEI